MLHGRVQTHDVGLVSVLDSFIRQTYISIQLSAYVPLRTVATLLYRRAPRRGEKRRR